MFWLKVSQIVDAMSGQSVIGGQAMRLHISSNDHYIGITRGTAHI